jgi:ATP-binding cassette subfamily B protein
MVAALPLGYLQQVGERGRNLSAGQRQLLALARAELVDPDVLLLDEATASLDLAAESRVTAATDALTRRRTTLVVAHRLTTAARADRVVVLDHGGVVESGTHAALLAADGPYRRLWDAFRQTGAATVDQLDEAVRPDPDTAPEPSDRPNQSAAGRAGHPAAGSNDHLVKRSAR